MYLYTSIIHDAGIQVLYEKLKERTDKKVPSTELVEITEFDTKIIQQISFIYG